MPRALLAFSSVILTQGPKLGWFRRLASLVELSDLFPKMNALGLEQDLKMVTNEKIPRVVLGEPSPSFS